MADMTADPDKWEAIDAERERYILFMLGGDEAARRFWEEWIPQQIELAYGVANMPGDRRASPSGEGRTLANLSVCAVSSGAS